MINCWIIPVIVGLLSAILGYLLGKACLAKKIEKCESEYNDEIESLRLKLADCQKSKKQIHTTQSAKSSDILPLVAFDAESAKDVFGKKIIENDLTIVEGIGKKIQELFHNADIKTWKSLSETSIEKCQDILNTGGDKFRIHNPNTWPRQAKLAYEGKWQELAEWQESLDRGVE